MICLRFGVLVVPKHTTPQRRMLTNGCKAPPPFLLVSAPSPRPACIHHQALFDVYLGDDPISPSALEAFRVGAKAL